MITIKMLPALAGDCIILKIHRNDTHQMIIIDGGMGNQCTHELLYEIVEWNSNYGPVDFVLLTHIDSDHISGLINIFKNKGIDNNSIKKIIFNYGEKLENHFGINSPEHILIKDASLYTSFQQGKELFDYLKKKCIEIVAPIIAGDQIVVDDHLSIDILSPGEDELRSFLNNKEYEFVNEVNTFAKKNDYDSTVEELSSKSFDETGVTITNASSISCMISYSGHRILLLGDAKSSIVENSLRKLGATEETPFEVDYCKISHHGSQFNTSNSLIRVIDCTKYLLSTNWKKGKPSKECLARIIMNSRNPVVFLCNYEPHYDVFSRDEYMKYLMKFSYCGNAELIINE